MFYYVTILRKLKNCKKSYLT